MQRKNRKQKFKRQEKEFDQQIVDLARVTRVMAGGKRLRFRATVVIGDRKKRVGIGTGKGKDVSLAISKAVKVAEKNIMNTPIVEGTIPCQITEKFGAAKILLKSAKEGTGIIAGGAVRTVLELSGLQNVVGKIYGSKNKINNVKATINALQKVSKMIEKREEILKKAKKQKDIKNKEEIKKDEEKK
ncbi:30S ribosomal protein S5 [Candidatus Falkowbacteria bacterium]|jgi:small subunit ribosomal protein S5|nr:30S ribosomal protein S5 [Candidatus Falkowbacteria bacterium]MBT4433011.1 30S ribosomal protein S5 [Candidatus Falkowbacteria bacterium]